MSFWWWTWNNVQITGGWNIRQIQMKTPLCLLRLSLFAPSFAAAPQKPDFDGTQIKDELIKWSTFILNKLWQVSPLPNPQTSPPATGSTNIALLLCRITIFLLQKLCWRMESSARAKDHLQRGEGGVWGEARNSLQQNEVMWQDVTIPPTSQNIPIRVRVIIHSIHCSISESNVL